MSGEKRLFQGRLAYILHTLFSSSSPLCPESYDIVTVIWAYPLGLGSPWPDDLCTVYLWFSVIISLSSKEKLLHGGVVAELAQKKRWLRGMKQSPALTPAWGLGLDLRVCQSKIGILVMYVEKGKQMKAHCRNVFLVNSTIKVNNWQRPYKNQHISLLVYRSCLSITSLIMFNKHITGC